MASVFPRVALLAAALVACGGSVEQTEPRPAVLQKSEQPEDVAAQRSAISYAEAVVIEPADATLPSCTGVLVAPRVVVTAAHCVAFTRAGFTVTAPFARGNPQSVSAKSAEPMDAAFKNLGPYDYEGRGLRDVGAVFLDASFTDVNYATLAPEAFNAGTTAPPVWVSSVGRAIGGTSGALALSLTSTLSEPAKDAQVNYTTTRLAADGESGGPLFLEGTHELVAVYAGVDADAKVDTWARLDGDVYTWITQKVVSHGGWHSRTPK